MITKKETNVLLSSRGDVIMFYKKGKSLKDKLWIVIEVLIVTRDGTLI